MTFSSSKTLSGGGKLLCFAVFNLHPKKARRTGPKVAPQKTDIPTSVLAANAVAAPETNCRRGSRLKAGVDPLISSFTSSKQQWNVASQAIHLHESEFKSDSQVNSPMFSRHQTKFDKLFSWWMWTMYSTIFSSDLLFLPSGFSSRTRSASHLICLWNSFEKERQTLKSVAFLRGIRHAEGMFSCEEMVLDSLKFRSDNTRKPKT